MAAGVGLPAVGGATAAELDATSDDAASDDAACGDDTAVWGDDTAAKGDAIVLLAPSDVRGGDDRAT